ncbi:DUF1127 domain-containing protein [Variovorax sp. KK3]|uniref:DUF1127 domain-containing protein n=1 Tax=Variovorax sp. KK3 TaxID=1855728 RepID=UPI00097C6DD6|nr:DUF1127 domain-containing protein [Variovorax sp. KK3]
MESKMQQSLHRLLQALVERAAAAQARRRARRQAQQLNGMSEHELLDLGIGRSEVPGLVHATRPR